MVSLDEVRGTAKDLRLGVCPSGVPCACDDTGALGEPVPWMGHSGVAASAVVASMSIPVHDLPELHL